VSIIEGIPVFALWALDGSKNNPIIIKVLFISLKELFHV
jgi:hypothetical protein